MSGEAPNMQLRAGKVYKLELRASGGLSIIPEKDLPAGGGQKLPPALGQTL